MFPDVLLGDRVDTDNYATERVVELEVLLLRAFHVRNVDRVLVSLEVVVSIVFLVRVSVRGADEREVSIFVLVEAASSFYDVFFVLCVTDMI